MRISDMFDDSMANLNALEYKRIGMEALKLHCILLDANIARCRAVKHQNTSLLEKREHCARFLGAVNSL